MKFIQISILLSLILIGLFAISGPAAAIDDNDILIAWTAPATEPNTQAANATGDVAFVNNAGELVSIIKVPDQANRVEPCGSNALSPDGRHFAFFMGVDTNNGGGLYIMTDGGTPIAIEDPGDMQFLGCVGGNGRFNYSPNSELAVYIDYEADARQAEFGDGILNVVNLSDYTNTFQARNVVSFDVNNDGVAYSQFFTNDFNEADEAAVIWWSRDSGSDREITAFTAQEDCKFTSSYVKVGPDGNIWLILRETCRQGSEWQLYNVNPEDRSARLALTQEPRGTLASFAETNNIFFSPNGETMFYTLPDGVTASSTGLYAINVEDMADPTELVARDALMPTYGSIRDGKRNAFPELSPNGRWYAVVVGNPNNENALHVYDLENIENPPVIISAGSRGDTVAFMEFTRDSDRLIFVAGGTTGSDNSIFALELENGSEFRVRRGAYAGFAALSPNGEELAVLEYQVQPEGIRGPDYLNLVVVNIESGETTTLTEGGEVVDDEVVNTSFASPWLWLRR